MAGSYGAENPRNDRYRLSFTVGGLLAPQGRIIAALFVGNEDRLASPIASSMPGEAAANNELGERVAGIRKQAIDGNVLSIRTESANTRIVREVVKRLSTLTGTEIRHLSDDDTPVTDLQALMWVAMCRYYAVVGEFANEVLRDHYLLGNMTVTREDYDRFILSKSRWHPELEELSNATACKLRSNLFKALDEAGLVGKSDNTLLPSLLSKTVTDILEERPESFQFFPMR